MNEQMIEQEMYRQATAFIEKRYPVGWGGAYPAELLEHYEEN